MSSKVPIKIDNECLKKECSSEKVQHKFMDENGFSMLHMVKGMKNNVLIDKLLTQGYSPKTGPWSEEEENQLKTNMEDFLQEYKLNSYESLIRPKTRDEREFRFATDFITKMSKFVNRTGKSVLLKSESLFYDNLRRGYPKGKDKCMLLNLVKTHGKRWTLIGNLMRWYKFDLQHFYIKLEKERKNFYEGEWKSDEINRLYKAIEFFKEKEYTWQDISKLVKTKSKRRCRSKWKLLHKDSWNDEYVKSIIREIKTQDLKYSSEIKWHEITRKFDDRFEMKFLKDKFDGLLLEVENSSQQPFPELISKLSEIHIPPNLNHDQSSDISENQSHNTDGENNLENYIDLTKKNILFSRKDKERWRKGLHITKYNKALQRVERPPKSKKKSTTVLGISLTDLKKNKNMNENDCILIELSDNENEMVSAIKHNVTTENEHQKSTPSIIVIDDDAKERYQKEVFEIKNKVKKKKRNQEVEIVVIEPSAKKKKSTATSISKKDKNYKSCLQVNSTKSEIELADVANCLKKSSKKQGKRDKKAKTSSMRKAKKKKMKSTVKKKNSNTISKC